MTSLRHIGCFLALGLFWGLSPSQYRYWGETGVPISHIIATSGLGIALFLSGLARWHDGRLAWDRGVMTYSLICATLMNVPFSLSLTFARHVPTAELALVFSLAPLISFAIGAATGRDPLTARRLIAVLIGFAASAVLILSRDGMLSGQVSWWLLASFVNPLLYAGYNWYAQSHWPRGGTTLSIGAAESLWSGLLAVPFVLALAPPWQVSVSSALAYWVLVAATLMWVIERIAFFTLIRERGGSYTAQAVYLSVPAAVIFAVIFFGGSSDAWLWVSLAIVMLALWLNNSGPAARPQSA